MGYFSGGYSLSETGPETDALLDEIAKVLFCQYGVTEYNDALTAYNAGKGLFAVYNKKTYILTDYTNSTFYFGQTTKALNYASLSLSASGWAVISNVGIAPTDSPIFTGTPTAPTADANSNDEQIATTAYADRASYNSLMEDTASGEIASFPDGAENVPVKEMVIQIEPVQSGSGDPSPDNIRPISGYTGAEIPVTGDNFIDLSAAENRMAVYSDGSVASFESDSAYATGYIPVKASTTYHQGGSIAGWGAGHAFYDADRNLVGFISLLDAKTANGNFTTPATAVYARFTATTGAPSIYEGSVDSGVLPYLGTTYSVSWSEQGTVYKGTAKYKGNGEWEITSLAAIIDMGTPAWVMVADSNHIFYADLAGKANGRTNLISSAYQTNAAIGMLLPDGCTRGEDNSNRTYVRNTAYASAADFKTAMAGQTILYDLATPTTFTVTGPDPETLLGDNNIWSDTGDISVKYRCNTALYIEKKLG